MKYKFYVGQKVVCIDDDLNKEWNNDRIIIVDGRQVLSRCVNDECPLELNKVYTISGMYISKRSGMICVDLAELERPFSKLEGRAIGFAAIRFKPVDEPKTDISILKSLLLDPSITIKEDKFDKEKENA